MSDLPDAYTAFKAWASTAKPYWVTDLSRYDGEPYHHPETRKAFTAFEAGRASVAGAVATEHASLEDFMRLVDLHAKQVAESAFGGNPERSREVLRRALLAVLVSRASTPVAGEESGAERAAPLDGEQIAARWLSALAADEQRTDDERGAARFLLTRTATAPQWQPMTALQIDRYIGPDKGDREAVAAIVREVEAWHGITESERASIAAAPAPEPLLTMNDAYTLLGHAVHERSTGKTDMPEFFAELAARIAEHAADKAHGARMLESFRAAVDSTPVQAAPAPVVGAAPAAEPSAAVLLAENVLHMDMVTDRGRRARELARKVLDASPCAEDTEAEAVLRMLASYLGAGGFNAAAVDAKVFHEKIMWGIKQVEERAALAPAPVVGAMASEGWTDADADAARLALELECMLTDKDMPMPTVSRWWDSAHEALTLHRRRLAAAPQPPAPAEAPQVNQCDGCQRGLPLTGLLHKAGPGDVIACTADRYASASVPRQGAWGVEVRRKHALVSPAQAEPLVSPARLPMPPLPNRGHGHVFPRPDGMLAKCGGPSICDECARDFALKNATVRHAAPAAPADDDDNDMVLIPRGLIGAACGAIWLKHDAPKTLEKLRRYTVGDLSATLVAPAEAVAVEVGGLPPLPDASFTYERHPSGFAEPECVGAYTADQMQAYARVAVAQMHTAYSHSQQQFSDAAAELAAIRASGAGGDADTLLRVIQRLNASPYSLTKSECIAEVSAMLDAARALAKGE